MSLLFDQNLSRRLPTLLADEFPGSEQVLLAGLSVADDRTVWAYAAARGLAVVSKDADFHRGPRGPGPIPGYPRFSGKRGGAFGWGRAGGRLRPSRPITIAPSWRPGCTHIPRAPWYDGNGEIEGEDRASAAGGREHLFQSDSPDRTARFTET